MTHRTADLPRAIPALLRPFFRTEGGRIRSIEVFFGFIPGAAEGAASSVD